MLPIYEIPVKQTIYMILSEVPGYMHSLSFHSALNFIKNLHLFLSTVPQVVEIHTLDLLKWVEYVT
jgi:hypothetical protein